MILKAQQVSESKIKNTPQMQEPQSNALRLLRIQQLPSPTSSWAAQSRPEGCPVLTISKADFKVPCRLKGYAIHQNPWTSLKRHFHGQPFHTYDRVHKIAS